MYNNSNNDNDNNDKWFIDNISIDWLFVYLKLFNYNKNVISKVILIRNVQCLTVIWHINNLFKSDV